MDRQDHPVTEMIKYVETVKHKRNMLPKTPYGKIAKAICDVNSIKSVNEATYALWDDLPNGFKYMMRMIIKFLWSNFKSQMNNL